MDYHLKYLKYKNKYINLKNMIGEWQNTSISGTNKTRKNKKRINRLS